MSLKIVMTLTPSMSLLCAIAVTAAEGAVSCWATNARYRWHRAREDGEAKPASDISGSSRIDLPFPDLVLVPYEDADEFPETVITPALLVLGMQRVLDKLDPAYNAYQSVWSALANDDASFIDADAADCIVQFGMFNELVYC